MSAAGGPSEAAQRQQPLDLCLAALVLVLAVMLCLPALHSLTQVWRVGSLYGHVYVLPLVAGYLVRRDRAQIAAALRELTPARYGALVAFGAGALEVLLWMGDVGFGAGLGVPFVLGAAAYAVGGVRLLRPLMLPLAFIALMVPPPRFLVYEMLFRLKLFVTNVSVELLHATGAVVVAQGNQILVPGHTLFVADACSGLTSIVTMFPLACVVAYFFSRGVWRRGVVIASVVPLALAANVLRVVVTVLLVSRLGEGVAQGALHEGFGMVAYAAGILAVLLVARARMRLRAQLIAAAFAFLAPTLVLVRWSVAVASPNAFVGPLELPRRVGTWTMRSEDRLDPVSLALAAPDSHVVRRYESPEGRGVWLYVGLYAERAGTGKSAHDPEVCYPAHGWEILGTRGLAISVGAEEFPAKLLELHRGLLKEEAVYWFQPARRWPAHPLVEQLLRVGDALAGRPQYAFVRLSTASTGNRSPATRDLTDFARQIAGSVRSAVEASH